MGAQAMTPPADASSPADSGLRKRVCKACDRCRLKKSKCDGSSPCSRCKADNAICVFGERKKSHDKVYPKGYVEMLENQQAQLVTGLQELYRRLQAGESWDGPALKETSRGTPLTHEILDHLGALKQDNVQGPAAFEENLEVLQHNLLANGAGFMQRETSFDASSEAAQSPMFETVLPNKAQHFSNPWSLNHFPPTPPFGSPRPSIVKASSPLKSQLPPATSQYTSSTSWIPEPSELSDNIDFNMTCDSPTEFDIHSMHPTTQMYFDPSGMAINPCLTMKDGWSTQDEQMNRYFQSGIFT